MREIKFRAWDNSRGIMRFGNDNLMMDLSGNLLWQFGYSGGNMLPKEERENYILMQFTGLFDKNKKEIYEGDIIEIESNDFNRHFGDMVKAEVCWGTCGWCQKGFPDDGRWWPDCKVVGNIHENPELLKGDKE